MSRKTEKISFCGIMVAVSIVLLFLAGITGIGTYAGPILCSLVSIIVFSEYGSKDTFWVYFITGIISFFIMPDRELALFYMLFGWYPAVLPHINSKVKKRIVRILLKLIIFASLVGVLYLLEKLILGIDLFQLAPVVEIILFILCAGCFLLMDVIYARISLLWRKKWRRLLRLK